MADAREAGRFVVQPPSERDVLEDDLSVSFYHVVDTEGKPDAPPKRGLPISNYPTLCYCRTLGDAEFVARFMNKGAV